MRRSALPPDADADCDTHSNTDGYAGWHTYSYTDRNPYGDADRDSHGHADCHTYSYTDRNPYGDADRDAYSHADCHTYSHSDCNTHGDANAIRSSGGLLGDGLGAQQLYSGDRHESRLHHRYG
jgi:hypothetical protein